MHLTNGKYVRLSNPCTKESITWSCSHNPTGYHLNIYPIGYFSKRTKFLHTIENIEIGVEEGYQSCYDVACYKAKMWSRCINHGEIYSAT